jgi:ribose 5-phosphate isomerase A
VNTAEAQKRAAAEAAAAMVEPSMVVGLGTGSTAAWFVKAVAALRLDVMAVATSEATAALATSLGIRLAELDSVDEIDLTVDGADEISSSLSLIKGGGGALLREKLTWRASRRCVVIADQSKVSQKLGRFPLPIEVVPFGARQTAQRIAAMLGGHGVNAAPRLRVRDSVPVRTDSGNLIYDAPCQMIPDPAALADGLKSITGVVEHGLFLGFAERALVGTSDGVIVLLP